MVPVPTHDGSLQTGTGCTMSPVQVPQEWGSEIGMELDCALLGSAAAGKALGAGGDFCLLWNKNQVKLLKSGSEGGG